MLRIGFSTKYFTLWDVTSEDVYSTSANGTHYHSGTNTRFTYYQNLSLDKDKAIEKAKSKGCTELEPDTDLYGRNRSFVRNQVFQYVYPDNQFKFGKYTGKEIMDSDDLEYIRWYYGQTDNDIAKARLLELDDDLMVFRGDLITKENYEYRLQAEENQFKLTRDGEIEVTFERNVNDHGTISAGGVQFYFPEIKSQYYSGFEYYLPSFNGKGKRIKNKTFVVQAHPFKFIGDDVFKVIKLIPVKK